MKKTITLPDKDTALFGFRTNLSLSDQRIFLYLLKSAFEQRKGLGANKKDVLQLYITFELGQALGKETGKFCVPCKNFADRSNEFFIYWNSKTDEIDQAQIEFTDKIFSQVVYKNGHMSFQFNPKIVSLLEAVINKFNRYGYDVSSLATANSKYASRLQEMLLLCRGSGQKYVFSLGQLRAVLLADDVNSYKATKGEFIRHCVEPAVQDISKASGESLTYKMLEDGKIQFGKQRLNYLLSNKK